MALSQQQIDEFFMGYVDDLAEILRLYCRRWGAQEQLDNEIVEQDARKRCFLGYSFGEGQAHPRVFAQLWWGRTGDVQELNDNKTLDIQLHAADFPAARIEIHCMPENGEDFAIDGEYQVHSVQELKDRIGVMWNADHWDLNNPHLEDNALLYRQFVPSQGYFKANIRAVIDMLKKFGALWGAELQTDNTPDPEDEKSAGIGGLLGGIVAGKSGKKRYHVSYTVPAFVKDDKGKAKVLMGSATLDLWQGKKGSIKKSNSGQQIHLDGKPNGHVRVLFVTGKPLMTVEGLASPQAKTPAELQKLLVALWKQNNFGV